MVIILFDQILLVAGDGTCCFDTLSSALFCTEMYYIFNRLDFYDDILRNFFYNTTLPIIVYHKTLSKWRI